MACSHHNILAVWEGTVGDAGLASTSPCNPNPRGSSGTLAQAVEGLEVVEVVGDSSSSYNHHHPSYTHRSRLAVSGEEEELAEEGI